LLGSSNVAFREREHVQGVPVEPITRTHAAHATAATLSGFVLEVTHGVDTGVMIQVDASRPFRVLVGKSPACDLPLHDPAVSRRHAAFDLSDEGVRISDLDSSNGTRVDGVGIIEAYLKGGESISLGDTRLRVAVDRLRRAKLLSTATHFGPLLGASVAMRRLYPLCARLADSDDPIIVEGETGTGKELLAEALHTEGARKLGPFVVFDCSAIPTRLLEAELFGQERGAFTGAVTSQAGVFERATGGTLLIDEVSELPLALQAKLLRAIERGEVLPLGATRRLAVNVRTIVATRKDLDREVQSGRFRDDLFHRLAVGRVELPPLRRRKGDVPLLAHHFWRALGGTRETYPARAVDGWQELAFSGNVRELRNKVARLLAIGELSGLGAETPALRLAVERPPWSTEPLRRVIERALDQPLAEARHTVVEQFERRYIERRLARHGGNVTHAAHSAQVARRYFQILKARRTMS
jgi:DNA-binding NtrC family response regulator